MKRIQKGEDIILAFDSETERDEYFEQAERDAGLEYKQDLADLLSGYQIGTQKAREAYGRVRETLEQERRSSLIISSLADLESNR